jgi:hypothetical protein
LGENESIVLDKELIGFVPEQPNCEWLILHKGQKDGHISKEENKKTKKIYLIRHPIKKKLGNFSSRFAIFTVKYQHERKWFTPLLHFGVAIHNMIASYFSSLRNFNKMRSDPIF